MAITILPSITGRVIVVGILTNFFYYPFCVLFAFSKHLTQVVIVLHLVQFSSVAQSGPTLCDLMNCSTPGLPSITNSRSSLKLTSIESVMPSSHLILCCPLLLLPPICPSIRVFSSESTHTHTHTHTQIWCQALG